MIHHQNPNLKSEFETLLGGRGVTI